MSKAFDILYWNFLERILLAFGFSTKWIAWILSLVSNAFLSILVNGVPSGPFSPSRGIRQGDPLSPFLFLLITEGLGRSLKAAIHCNALQGLKLSEEGEALSHLQFVDDNLLIGSSTSKEASA
jgi:hypothetical protein